MFSALKKPFLAFAAVTVASVGVAAPSTTASSPDARHAAQMSAAQAAKPTPWSPWKKNGKAKPFTMAGCGNKLTISEAVNRSESRTRTDRDGNFHVQFRGVLHWRINPERGHTVVVDISGPGKVTIYGNDDVYFKARGRNGIVVGRPVYRNSTPTKLPRLFLSTGALSIFNDGNDTRKSKDDQSTILDQPDRYWNICPVVKSGVVPKPFRV